MNYKNSSEPINFWSGDTSLKDMVQDEKGYHMEMARLLFILLNGIMFAIFAIAGIVMFVFGCSAGIYLACRVYKGIFG